jgi:hypothetical protein
MECVKGRWDGIVRLGHKLTFIISDIDEALFQLTGLLDYRAAISESADGRFHLSVDVHKAEGSRLTEGEVIQVLTTVEAIRKGIAGADLEIPNVRFSADGCWTTTGVAKRKIITTSDQHS